MANLNLSEFTEKLFVADADHTFIWDSAASISKRVSRNSWLNSGTLTSDAPVTISQTWNGTGSTVFTALKVVATDTVSGATSNLLELWAGSTPILRFNVGKNGTVAFRSGNVFGDIATDGVGRVLLNASSGNGARVTGDLHIGSANVVLLRDGADNTLALRNGALAQTFRVYGAYPDTGINYARLALSCDTSGNATISTQALGTYTAGTVSINGVPVGRGTGTQSFNIAVGSSALLSKTTGDLNVALGVNSSAFLTTGNQNTALGANSLISNTTGSNNTVVGYQAARYITGGATALTVSENSVYLGAESRAAASGETNQIVIGYQATGIGSNSVVLGNDSITKTALKGNVGIGTTSPTSKLDVAGAVTAAGYYTATSGGVSLVANGLWQQGTGHLTLASGAILGWSGQVNVNIDQPGDTRLQRDEAYHLALRNGTNGQKFSVYGTYPGAAWERFTITAPTSGNVLLGTYKGTGGIARGLEIQTDGVTRISFDPASVNVTFQGAILTATANQTIVRTGANSILAASNDGTIRAIKLRGDAGGALGWASGGDPTGGLSAAIMQVSAGVLALGDGTLNSVAGSLNLTNINAVGNVISRPSASITPAANGDLVVEATSNTTLTFKLKGTDGTVRTGTITLA